MGELITVQVEGKDEKTRTIRCALFILEADAAENIERAKTVSPGDNYHADLNVIGFVFPFLYLESSQLTDACMHTQCPSLLNTIVNNLLAVLAYWHVVK